MVRFKQLLDTPANWTTNNPILARGEIGVERDSLTGLDKLKIGNGITAWNDLAYFAGGTETTLEDRENGFFKLTTGDVTCYFAASTIEPT